jgi:hypothetical protein
LIQEQSNIQKSRAGIVWRGFSVQQPFKQSKIPTLKSKIRIAKERRSL